MLPQISRVNKLTKWAVRIVLYQEENDGCMLPCFSCVYAHLLNPPFPHVSSSEQFVDIVQHKVQLSDEYDLGDAEALNIQKMEPPSHDAHFYPSSYPCPCLCLQTGPYVDVCASYAPCLYLCLCASYVSSLCPWTHFLVYPKQSVHPFQPIDWFKCQ